MKLKLLSTSLLLITIAGSICGCNSKEYDETYGYRIDEDLSEVEIIDDNYRNYYEIFVRSFADSDGDGIGDLNGVKEKLPYIKELGYTGIWLMPINTSPSYHKYDVENYYEIDPSYGSMEDFEELLDAAHDLDIKIIIDFVMNHSSKENELFIKAGEEYEKYLNNQTYDSSLYNMYSFYKDENEASSAKVTYYKYPGKNFYYEGNFSSDMPEFNFDSDYTKEYFKDLAKYYLDLGVDGFRLDATLYYYLNNNSKNIELLKEFNNYVKSINEDAYIVGECWSNSQTIKQYYTSGIDSFFYFPISITDPNSFIINSINRDGIYCENYFNGLIDMLNNCNEGISAPFLDNHDTSRFTRVSSKEKTKFFYGLLSMLNGTTFTYYGDEVGMTGAVKPDENVRIPIMWRENDEYNTKPLSGTSETNEYFYGSVEENIADDNSIYNYYKKANYLRNKFPSIARGENKLVKVDKDNGLLIIQKNYNNDDLYLAINFKEYNDNIIDVSSLNKQQVVGQLVVDINKYIGDKGDNKIIMPPYSIALLK